MDVLFGLLLLAALLALPVGYGWLMVYAGAEVARARRRREEWALVALLLGPLGLAIVYMLPPLPEGDAR